MKKKFLVLSVSALVLLLSRCRKPELFPEANYDERLSGGSQTTFDNTQDAFSIPFEGLSDYDFNIHVLGDKAFEHTFVAAPAPINSGLGPCYNNISCRSCHHNDGIGIPTAGEDQSSLLMR